MAINYSHIICYDFETGGRFPQTCPPLQLAACVINPRTLEINEEDVFQVLIKPADWSQVESEALAVNHLTREIIEEKGVDLKLAWADFVTWVEKYNPKKTFWSAPVGCGMNIKGFDKHIINRLSKQYGPCDKDTGESTLFSKRDEIDLLNILFLVFENRNDLKKYNMDTVREYLGIDKTGSHDARKDCIDTAKIIIRFMKMFRNKFKSMEFKDSFKDAS